MRKAPQEIFPKAGARRGWIWNNDAILCPCLGCNEPEDWWGHSCYRMMLEGFLRALGRITEKKKFRARQVRGSSWPQQSTEWGGGGDVPWSSFPLQSWLSLFASPQREFILREHGLQVRITENSWLWVRPADAVFWELSLFLFSFSWQLGKSHVAESCS